MFRYDDVTEPLSDDSNTEITEEYIDEYEEYIDEYDQYAEELGYGDETDFEKFQKRKSFYD